MNMKSREQLQADDLALAGDDQTAPDRFFRTDHLMDTIGGRTARGGVVTMV